MTLCELKSGNGLKIGKYKIFRITESRINSDNCS